ncbi:hypothetical protein Hanom_Chr09g00815301 [Helianthus anomalus]
METAGFLTVTGDTPAKVLRRRYDVSSGGVRWSSGPATEVESDDSAAAAAADSTGRVRMTMSRVTTMDGNDRQ